MRFCVVGLLVLTSSCASMRGLIMGEDDNTSRGPASVAEETDNTSWGDIELKRQATEQGSEVATNGEFSSLARQHDDGARRGYRRSSDPWTQNGPYNEGSIWNPETQTGFYFTRNTLFQVGDFITLALEPDMMENVNQKLITLYKPLKSNTRDTVAAEAGKALGDKVSGAVNQAVKNANVANAIGQDVSDRTQATLKERPRYFTTKEIPLRVVEITNKGMIKVEGNRTLFLRNANFEMKVGGLIREEDIGPTRMIASSKLIEPKVEVNK